MGSGFSSSSQDDCWAYSAFLFFYSGCLAFQLADRKGFRSVEFADFQGSLQRLTSSHLRNEIKCCYEPFCAGEFGTDSFLARPRKKMFLVGFVVKGMVMVTYSGSVPSPSPPSAC